MRKIIIDTDTASDDAVALIMALKSKDLQIEAITTVAGNCNLDLATKNALMTLEITDTYYPTVYKGASKPLFRSLNTAVGVHGHDGMGDSNLINPTRHHEEGHAVDKIIELVKQYPNEIEIVTIGPATNIALALLKEPSIMKNVKHIYSMGTGGFGPGNATPVAEFNVYVDAEAYDIMLKSGIPITIIGFDVCLGDAALSKQDMDYLLQNEKKEAVFSVKCNKTLLEFNLERNNKHIVDLPDAVAMGVVLWDDIVLESHEAFCYTCTNDEITYGQVVIHCAEGPLVLSHNFVNQPANATVCKTIDNHLFKKRLLNLLIA